jgi:dihydrodipicolinate synthase/N-acetylneuraminate lyase
VTVTCSHFNIRIAIEHAWRAEAAGARMLMLMPPYHGATLRADERDMFEQFARVAEAVSIPPIAQDAPLLEVSTPAASYFSTASGGLVSFPSRL